MKQFWIKQLLFFSFLVLFLPVLSALNFAQDNYSDRKIVLINDVNVSMALGKHIRFLEDKDRYLTIENFFLVILSNNLGPEKMILSIWALWMLMCG